MLERDGAGQSGSRMIHGVRFANVVTLLSSILANKLNKHRSLIRDLRYLRNEQPVKIQVMHIHTHIRSLASFRQFSRVENDNCDDHLIGVEATYTYVYHRRRRGNYRIHVVSTCRCWNNIMVILRWHHWKYLIHHTRCSVLLAGDLSFFFSFSMDLRVYLIADNKRKASRLGNVRTTSKLCEKQFRVSWFSKYYLIKRFLQG